MGELFSTLKKIWPFMKPHKKNLIAIFLSGAMMAALSPVAIELVNRLYHAFDEKDAHAAQWIPYSFPILFIFLGGARYYHTKLTKFTAELVLASIRRRMIEQFVHLNLSFHNSFGAGSGGLLNRVLTDTAILQEGLYFMVAIFREPILIIVLLVQMILINWQLTAFSFILAPVFIIMMKQVRKSLRKYGHLNREAMDSLASTLKESLDGVRIIQSFNLEDKIMRRFDSNQADYLDTRYKIINREEAISPVNEIMGSIGFMCFAIFAFRQILGGTSTPAEFTAFVMAAGILQPPIKNFQTALVKLQQSYVVVDRLFALIDSEMRVTQIANPKPFPKTWSKIRFDHVSFAYGEELVLKNFSMTIHKGEVVALVGESGSGKSTVVNLLGRYFDPSQGQIYIDDTPINEFSLKDLRKNIALVTQDVFLFKDSIAENIHAGDLEKQIAHVEGAARSANAHQFISSFPLNYQNQVGERGGFLSGGEKQRISIARAIFKDAPILILDEATSALDSVSEMEVQKGLQKLMEGRTAFVIAHRLSTIFNSDRIIVMKKGEVVEHGNHKSLIEKRGEYFNFYNLQMNQNDRMA
jgi:subfamily B ATP-binding cassette protein MsbA